MTDLRAAAPFFVLRTPLLSAWALRRWGDGLSAPGALGAEADVLERALAADRELLRRRLDALVRDEQFADALTVASPELAGAVAHWRADPQRREHRSAERSLVFFLGRCASRPDLSGLAGSYTLGAFGNEVTLELPDRREIVAHARIDPGLLAATVRSATGPALAAGGLMVRTNEAVYRVGDRLRVAARMPGENRHQIVALPSTEAIESTLAAAADGATVNALLDGLRRDGMDGDAARGLVNRLVERELLIPVHRVTVTGSEPTVQTLATLRAIPGANGAARAVQRAADVVGKARRFDRHTIGAVRAAMEEAGQEVSPRFCIQVDAARPGEVQLTGAVRTEMWRSVELLMRIGAQPRSPALARFCEDFERRFGTRSVPLLSALDPDCGVRLDERAEPEPAPSAARSARRQTLLELIVRGSRTGDGTVRLERNDVERLSSNDERRPPPSVALSAGLLARDAAAVASGDFQLLEPKVTGPGGARMLGRLCHGDPELERLVREHLRREAAAEPELIFADLATMADTRAGFNVTHRPVLHDREIDCGGASGAEPARRLDPSDLLVGIEANQVVVRERSSGRRVVPSPTSAVNYEWISLPAVRLLARVCAEGMIGAAYWSWDEFRDAPHLPRVVYGKTILALRRWNVSRPALEPPHLPLTAAAFREIHGWRRRHGIPRVVRFEDRRGPIAVDFDNVLSVEAFVSRLGGLERVGLVEAPDLRRSPVRAPDGPHAHMLIVPFAAAPARPAPARPAPARPAPARAPRPGRRVPESKRRFAPGSQWLFANLYGPPALADRMLLEHVRPLVDELTRAGVIDRWFFIRYADPAPHLRVRLHGDPAALCTDAVPALARRTTAALDAGLLHRVSFDTYEREVERYGGLEGVELMERASGADSDAVLAILAMPAQGGERRRITVASLAALYADSGLELERRCDCATELRGWFASRYSRPLGKLLGAEERRERPEIVALMSALDLDGGDPRIGALRARSATLRPVLERWRELERDGALERSFVEVMQALAHMFVNRLLKTGGGLDELRVHDALARFYAGELARRRAHPIVAKA